MPVVQGTFTKPDGTAPAYGQVVIRLVSSGSQAAGFSTSGHLAVAELATATVAADGTWSATLRANSLIEQPTGTYYQVTATLDSQPVAAFNITVPNGAGPYRVEDILTSTPAAPATSYATTSYVDSKWPARPAAAATLLKKLAIGAEDCAVLAVGDSTATMSTHWIYLTMAALAADWPAYTFRWRPWNDTNSSYDAATTITTGTGARICTVYSGCVPGTNITYITGTRFPAMARDIGNVDAIIINHGMNETWTVAPFERYVTLVEMLKQAQPAAGIIAVLQNYRTDGASNTLHSAYEQIAGARGLEAFDIAALVAANIGTPTVATSDGVHPTTATQTYIATEAIKRFRGYPYLTQLPSPSSLFDDTGSSLIRDNGFVDATMAGWANQGNSVTVSVDITRTDGITGRSIRLQSVAATSLSAMAWYFPTSLVTAVQGEWVTFAARMWRPSNASGTHGVLTLGDQNNFARTDFDNQPNNCWHWQWISYKVSTNANILAAKILADYTSSASGDIRIDRVWCGRGRFPKGYADDVTLADSVTARSFAGAVSDLSFNQPPDAGTMAVDSTNSKLYVRVGSTWKSVTLS